MTHPVLHAWHKVLESKDSDLLDDLLAEDAVFISPVVFSPQPGKAKTKAYLMAASLVLGNESFRYLRTMSDDNGAMLEFEVEVDGIYINGIDLIRWNANKQITEFKVMLRPLQAVNLVHEKMATSLKSK